MQPKTQGPVINKTIPTALDPRVKGLSNLNPEQKKEDPEAGIVKGEFETDQSFNKETKPVDESMLKPKKSKFEPDPVEFKLPSFGKSIPKHLHKFLTEDKSIYIRRITAQEEIILSKLRDRPDQILKTITQCLDSCLKTNIDIKHFMLIDKIPMFLFLIDISYKQKDDKINITCPECKQTQERKISIKDDLKIRYMDKSTKYPLELTTNKSYDTKYIITFDAPTFEHEKLFESEDLEATHLLHNLVLTITDSDGKNVPKEDWLELINNLDSEDRIRFRDTLSDMTDKFGTDTKIDFTCSNKGCIVYNKNTKTDIPLDQIFLNLANNKTI